MKAYIYAIKNVINNKMYIGSTKSPKSRKPNHFWYLKKGKHHSMHLQNSYNKYGKDKFFFYILEECNINNRKERELYNINLYKTYNRNFGYNIYEPNEDKFKCSKETKNKIIQAFENNGRLKPIDVYDLKGNLINSYKSINSCAKELKLPKHSIIRILKNKARSFKGYTFEYKNKPFKYTSSLMQRNMNKFYK